MTCDRRTDCKNRLARTEPEKVQRSLTTMLLRFCTSTVDLCLRSTAVAMATEEQQQQAAAGRREAPFHNIPETVRSVLADLQAFI